MICKKIILLFLLCLCISVSGCGTYYTDDELSSINESVIESVEKSVYETAYKDGYKAGQVKGYNDGYKKAINNKSSKSKKSILDMVIENNKKVEQNKNQIQEEKRSKQIVYITEAGKCYHSKNCDSLYNSKIKITLKDAKEDGYRPCEKCNPPN